MYFHFPGKDAIFLALLDRSASLLLSRVGERVGAEARGPTVHDALGQPAEVLHEHEAERDRDGPELADGQGLYALEPAHEALQRLRLHAAVGVRDELPGQAEHAGISLQRLLRELGELAIESAGEVLANLPHRLVGDVEVVDEPFRGGGDRPFLPDHRRDLAIALRQDAAAVAHVRREEVSGSAAGQDRPTRDVRRELLQALGTQELGPDRLLGLAGEGRRGDERPEASETHVRSAPRGPHLRRNVPSYGARDRHRRYRERYRLTARRPAGTVARGADSPGFRLQRADDDDSRLTPRGFPAARRFCLSSTPGGRPRHGGGVSRRREPQNKR
ncbi:MAG TPA: hypothetical protein VIX40_11815 [Methylomirabilota bacterium]